MDNNQGMIGMALGSWLVALAGGFLAGVLLWVLGGWSFMQGAFMGFVVWIIFGIIISWVMTRPLPGPADTQVTLDAAPSPAAPAPQPAETPDKSAPPSAAAPVAAPTARTSKASDDGDAPKTAKAAPATSAPDKGDGRPADLTDKPRAGGADDLKLIGGVGPKLEETLNSLGIWHFDQVAGLKKKDIAWVDERLRFKGRIERDDWVGQAKTLADGGDTEFSKKKRKS